ncbi:MAG: hypothetical protein JXX14_25890 [Deltaproteobacteria bacterium]|nr:hypothetical protein [Deltaproteobacteria bacterium]
MATRISYNRFENDLMHQYRSQMSGAESSSDVEKFFDYTVRSLCDKIFDGNIKINQQDIQYTQDGESLYQVHRRLLDSKLFADVWENSDLPKIVERFAQTAHHRAIHLDKHREKTNLKIRR